MFGELESIARLHHMTINNKIIIHIWTRTNRGRTETEEEKKSENSVFGGTYRN